MRPCPSEIAALEAEDTALEAAMADPAFYKTGAAEIAGTLARLEAVRRELQAAYARWDALDSRTR